MDYTLVHHETSADIIFTPDITCTDGRSYGELVHAALANGHFNIPDWEALPHGQLRRRFFLPEIADERALQREIAAAQAKVTALADLIMRWRDLRFIVDGVEKNKERG